MPESLPGTVDAAVPGRTVEHEPQWLRALAFGSAAAVAAFGGIGLLLAVAGVYRSYFVFPLGAVVWLVLLALARPILLARGATTGRAHAVAALGVLFVGGMTFWNARHASQHVLISRDPGVYVNAGRWIALHGNLHVHAAVGPFLTQPGLVFGSFGMYPSGGFLSFQFAHLLPALLAEAHDLGGDRLMFAAGPALGGVALLAFFVAAWRLVREPIVAFVALVVFAILLPQISFSRDAFSEIPMQVLLFTALWILADRRAFRRARVAFVAGLLLGLMQAARIDALVALIGLPLLFAVMWLLADVRNRRAVATSAGACALGLVPGLVLGAVDVSLRSHQYVHDLRGQVKTLVLLMIASIVAALVLVAVGPAVARRISRIPDWVGWAAGGLVALGLFGLWFVRPGVQHVHGANANPLIKGLQKAAHVKVDSTRTYAERSMTWMSWYLGPVALVTAIVAAALLVRMLVRGRMWFAFVGVALLGPASAVYLWRPNITTDQIWVMRRYLVTALPLFVLLAFGLVAALARARWHRVSMEVFVAIAILLAGGALAPPLRAVDPVPNITEERGYLLALRDACHTVGRDAAIVLLHSPTGLMSQWAPQTLRGWCNVPVAVMRPKPTSPAALAHLAAGWSAAGRRLWVVADDPATITNTLPAAKPRATPLVVNPFLLEMALLHRPGSYGPQRLSLVMAPVRAADSTRGARR